MDDTRSASLVLIAGAAGVAWWFYHLTQGKLAPAAAAPAEPGGLPTNTVTPGNPLAALEDFAHRWGLTITSEVRPGGNSLHAEGRAIDVGVPDAGLQGQIKAAAAALGIHVYPEVAGQVGANGSVSTGAHWHLSFPEWRNGRLVW